MEANKTELEIEDYAVNQTSLEQVKLHVLITLYINNNKLIYSRGSYVSHGAQKLYHDIRIRCVFH